MEDGASLRRAVALLNLSYFGVEFAVALTRTHPSTPAFPGAGLSARGAPALFPAPSLLTFADAGRSDGRRPD